MELLSPAGSHESLTAAIQNGADAVYFGGSAFNARRFAANFSGEEMKSAIDYCHLHGVKAYVTLNTLILDKEMREALEYAAELYRMNVDAVLIQDLGLMKLLREELPLLCLHASTQMAIHDLEGVLAAQSFGLERVVLARELPLNEIRKIHEATDMELEVFVHGALCMSASGNCLFSSMVGDRSGNRGTCAQPCRKRIKTLGKPNEEDYHLSLSDLCMVEHIEELKNSGVSSLKVEGRMKRPEYVAAVTRAYRAALDGADDETIKAHKSEMLRVFQRGGAHTGYFFKDDNQTDCVAENTHDEKLLADLRASYAQDNRKNPLKMRLLLRQGENVSLFAEGLGKTALAERENPAKAEKTQDAGRYCEQMKKLGGTPFYSDDCTVETDGISFLSAGEINAMRREVCAEISRKICEERKCENPSLPYISQREETKMPELYAKVRTLAQAETAFSSGADKLIFEPWNYAALELGDIEKYRDKLILSLPAVIRSREEHKTIMELIGSGFFVGAEANNIAQLSMISKLPERIAGLSMNAYNRYAVKMLSEAGCTQTVLSLELTKPQLRDVLNHAGGMLHVYGRIPLMQLRHCPRKEHMGCAGCEGDAGNMQDEAGRIFPLDNIKQSDGCLIRLLNSETMDIIDHAGDLTGCGAWLLSFYRESADEIAERMNAARKARNGEKVNAVGTTRGHWNRALQ